MRNFITGTGQREPREPDQGSDDGKERRSRWIASCRDVGKRAAGPAPHHLPPAFSMALSRARLDGVRERGHAIGCPRPAVRVGAAAGVRAENAEERRDREFRG